VRDDTLIVHVRHRKCGTHWFLSIFEDLSRTFDLQLQTSTKNGIDEKTRIVIGDRSALQGNYIATHMIRDPRDIAVSAYFYHLHRNVSWTEERKAKIAGKPKEEGLMAEIDDCMHTFRTIAGHDYTDPKVMELKYEDVILNQDEYFDRIFRWYGFDGDELKTCMDIARRNSFKAKTGRELGEESKGDHLRKGFPGEWREHFTDNVKVYFKEKTENLIVDLGYEVNVNW